MTFNTINFWWFVAIGVRQGLRCVYPFAPLGVHHLDMPMALEVIWRAITAAKLAQTLE